MNREQLAHVLRAASGIVDDPDILVIGSQSLLASYDEEELPLAATTSMEVDLAYFDDADDLKADIVDGAIGELSPFHESFGYYAQGVSVRTAVLPTGWRDRVIHCPATRLGARTPLFSNRTIAWCPSSSLAERRTAHSPRPCCRHDSSISARSAAVSTPSPPTWTPASRASYIPGSTLRNRNNPNFPGLTGADAGTRTPNLPLTRRNGPDAVLTCVNQGCW